MQIGVAGADLPYPVFAHEDGSHAGGAFPGWVLLACVFAYNVSWLWIAA